MSDHTPAFLACVIEPEPMHILHAADLHLDSPLVGLSRYDGAPVERMRLATRRAFEALIDRCLELDVKLLLLAGDLYDGDWRDYSTGLFFVGQLSRLRETGCSVVFVRGNHDAQSKITRQLRLPEHVTELSHRAPQTLRFDELGVVVHGQGFAKPAVTDDLAAGYPDAQPGTLNFGLLHTSLTGRPGHEPYAPCSVERLVDRGYDYWALGHVHQREVVRQQPWIVFPGNLQGRHAREVGEKGATLIRVEGGRILGVEPLTFDVVRWAHVNVDVGAAQDVDDVLQCVEGALSRERDNAEGRLLAARVTLLGASALHAQLTRDIERVVAEVRGIGLSLDEVWIEKVRVDTKDLVDVDAALEREDVVGRVARSFDKYAADEDALRALSAELSELKSKLPVELKHGPDALRFEDPGDLAPYLSEAKQLLLARLLERQD